MAEEQGLSAEDRALIVRVEHSACIRDGAGPFFEFSIPALHRLLDAARSEGPLPVGGEGREDLGSVGSGLTPLVPSRVSDAGSATPSGDGIARAVHRARCEMGMFLKAASTPGERGYFAGRFWWAMQDVFREIGRLDLATPEMPPEGVAIKPASDGEARQAKPAGDRTQDRTTPNLPPRAKP